jgi:hypothetical protein
MAMLISPTSFRAIQTRNLHPADVPDFSQGWSGGDVSLRLGRPPDARTVPGQRQDRASKLPELSPIWVQLKSQSSDGKYYRNRFSQTPKATSYGPEPPPHHPHTRPHSATRRQPHTAAGWN